MSNGRVSVRRRGETLAAEVGVVFVYSYVAAASTARVAGGERVAAEGGGAVAVASRAAAVLTAAVAVRCTGAVSHRSELCRAEAEMTAAVRCSAESQDRGMQRKAARRGSECLQAANLPPHLAHVSLDGAGMSGARGSSREQLRVKTQLVYSSKRPKPHRGQGRLGILLPHSPSATDLHHRTHLRTLTDAVNYLIGEGALRPIPCPQTNRLTYPRLSTLSQPSN